MTGRFVQNITGSLRRRFGWKLPILAVSCLGLGACVASWTELDKVAPDQGQSAPPATSVPGASGLKFIPNAGSKVELQGATTIGSWTSRSTEVQGQVILYADEAQLDELFDRIEAAPANDPKGVSAPPPLTLPIRGTPIAAISVLVKSLRGDSSGMDHDMQKALKAAQHPVIEYVLQNLQQATVQVDPQGHRAAFKLSIVGRLNMAGVERPISMDVIVTRDARRHFLAHAQTKLLMSDFGVTPPVALFGLIKAEQRVFVTFDLDLVSDAVRK